MADTYWDHPSRREVKRLLDLGDAGAILDELQNQTTEWDDAREALDHMLRGATAGPQETAAADPMTPERLAEIREREQAATRGPWEPGNVWLIAGLIYDDDGNRVDPETATRCGFCHLGEPAWSGRRSINGPIMNAHRHRNPEPWGVENLISAANGDLVAGNFDYEEGGIIAPADTAFVAAAREDVPALLAEVERLRAEQVQGIEQAVHAFFADADQRGVHLDGMTVTELCDAVMAEIRALGGTEAGRD